MESELMYRNTTLTYYLFLELIRMFIYLIITYHMIFNIGFSNVIVKFNIIKYWAIIIAARVSEKWMIKYE